MYMCCLFFYANILWKRYVNPLDHLDHYTLYLINLLDHLINLSDPYTLHLINLLDPCDLGPRIIAQPRKKYKNREEKYMRGLTNLDETRT